MTLGLSLACLPPGILIGRSDLSVSLTPHLPHLTWSLPLPCLPIAYNFKSMLQVFHTLPMVSRSWSVLMFIISHLEDCQFLKGGIMFPSCLHLEVFLHGLHTVENVWNLCEVCNFFFFKAASLSCQVRNARAACKQIFVSKWYPYPFPVTISHKPCVIYDSHLLSRFQQSTTPYSVLTDYRRHTFHKETAEHASSREEMPGRLTTRNRISRKSRAPRETLSKWENGSVTFYLMEIYENSKALVASEANLIHMGPRTHAGIWYMPTSCSERSLSVTEPTKTLFFLKSILGQLHHFKNAQSVDSMAGQGFGVDKKATMEVILPPPDKTPDCSA